MKILILFAILFFAGCTSKTAKPTGSRASQVQTEKIRDVIRASAHTIRSCYEQLIVTSPNAAGKAVINFEVDDQGSVREPNLRDVDPTLTTLNDCIPKIFLTLHFPKAPEHTVVEVSYPLCFSSGSGNDCFDHFRAKETK